VKYVFQNSEIMQSKSLFVIVFDIPRGSNTLRTRVRRTFEKFGVKKIQESVWSSENPALLVDVAEKIKMSRGRAKVFKAESVF